MAEDNSSQYPKQYVDKRPGFSIKSGTTDHSGKKIDYSMLTDNAQGFEYTQDGYKYDVTNKSSVEVVGQFAKKDEIAKGIFAVGGDIVIDAMDGDVIIKGMNIRIQAVDGSGEVTIFANKQIQQNASVVNTKGAKVNILATNSAQIAGQTVDTRGNIQNASTSGSEDTQGDVLTQIMSAIKNFKNWFG